MNEGRDLQIAPAAFTVKYKSLDAVIQKVSYVIVEKFDLILRQMGSTRWRS